MIITWRGLGFLALLTWLVPWMAVWGYTTELWPVVLGHIASISLTYAVGRTLNRNKVRHYLYDIRFEYSGFVLSGICAVLYLFFHFLGAQAPHSVPPPEKPAAKIGVAAGRISAA